MFKFRAFPELLRYAGARVCYVALVLHVSLGGRTSFAAESSRQTARDEARVLAVKGADAFVAKDYSVALERFQRASALYSAPTITMMEARSLAALGRLREATEVYEKVEKLTLPTGAPQAFRQAVNDAKQEGKLVRERLASVVIEVDASIEGLTLRLDNDSLNPTSFGSKYRLDPGSHTLKAQAPGYLSFERTFALDERQSETVGVVLQPLLKPILAGMSSNHAPARSLRPQSTDTTTLAGVVTLATGGALLVASAGLYTVAWREKHTLDGVCTPTCPAGYADDIDAFRLHRTLAFIGFGTSIATLAAGSYLVWGSHKSGPHAAASLGPTSVVIRGAF